MPSPCCIAAKCARETRTAALLRARWDVSRWTDPNLGRALLRDQHCSQWPHRPRKVWREGAAHWLGARTRSGSGCRAGRTPLRWNSNLRVLRAQRLCRARVVRGRWCADLRMSAVLVRGGEEAGRSHHHLSARERMLDPNRLCSPCDVPGIMNLMATADSLNGPIWAVDEWRPGWRQLRYFQFQINYLPLHHSLIWLDVGLWHSH